MGMNAYTHVGAYAVAIAPKVEKTVYLDRACPTHGTIRSQFCPECGQPAQRVERRELRYLSQYDLLTDDLADDLSAVNAESDPGILIFISNNVDDSTLDGDVVEINTDIIEGCKAAFVESCGLALAELDRQHVVYQIKFGVVHYVN